MSEALFNNNQARVIAALVEKSLTTPQNYPLTVNSLVNACNQKSCRKPVMNLSEGAVGAALTDLEARGFCRRDESSSRAVKWRHQFNHQMLLQLPTQALLVTLMLRGPQTVAELRSNAEGLKGPASTDEVLAHLELLTDRAEPLICKLPRASGQKEDRYVQLLCGTPDLDALATESAAAASSQQGSRSGGLSELLERIEALEARVNQLEGHQGTSTSA